jgi:hypothetical protein
MLLNYCGKYTWNVILVTIKNDVNQFLTFDLKREKRDNGIS